MPSAVHKDGALGVNTALNIRNKPGCANFTSDNTAGAMPEVLAALSAAAAGTVPSYGADPHTARLNELFSAVFETECTVFAVATGTAANCLAMAACCKPYSGVLVHEGSHMNVDEAGAPEHFTNGAKLLPIAGADAKITAAALRAKVEAATTIGDYGGIPAVVSVTQVNEAGLLYSLEELDALSAVAREAGIVVHMDGARFANAVEGLGCTPAEMTWKRGVDILSFGGTKNGCLAAEAVVVFKRSLLGDGIDFRLRLKRSGHMWSKMRFLSAQLEGYLGDPTSGRDAPWRRHARHGNAMASRLAAGIEAASREFGLGQSLRITQPVQSNEVFMSLPEHVLAGIFADGHACLDIGQLSGRGRRGELVRCVCCWNTKEEEVARFLQSLRRAAASAPPPSRL
jgi:threonine aldolase